MTLENPVVGFGYLANFSEELVEWYLVFSDGERSECKTNHRLLDFSEKSLPEGASPRIMILSYHCEDSKLMGIQLLDGGSEPLL